MERNEESLTCPDIAFETTIAGMSASFSQVGLQPFKTTGEATTMAVFNKGPSFARDILSSLSSKSGTGLVIGELKRAVGVTLFMELLDLWVGSDELVEGTASAVAADMYGTVLRDSPTTPGDAAVGLVDETFAEQRVRSGSMVSGLPSEPSPLQAAFTIGAGCTRLDEPSGDRTESGPMFPPGDGVDLGTGTGNDRVMLPFIVAVRSSRELPGLTSSLLSLEARNNRTSADIFDGADASDPKTEAGPKAP